MCSHIAASMLMELHGGASWSPPACHSSIRHFDGTAVFVSTFS